MPPDPTSGAGEPRLRRSLSLPLLFFYGLGTIVGAGIYVLMGEVAGEAGLGAPLAFALAALIAAFTAFSYAELSARFPQAAGEAVYLKTAFGRRWPAALAGWGVVAVGSVSSATLAHGFHGYLGLFLDLPAALTLTALIIALGSVAAWGIRESAWFAAAVTCIELGGLVWVVFSGADALATLPLRWQEMLPSTGAVTWIGLGAGAFLAFYAFIGFEDMVNVAEEVRNPQRTLPRAIIGALIASTLLYVVVALVAVLTVPMERLAGSPVPLAEVVRAGTGREPIWIGLVSLVAVVNGALIQIIMASRVLYGMGLRGMGPARFARVHPRRRTPLLATLAVTAAVLVLALALPLGQLARITSLITLLVYAGVNAALWHIRRRDGRATDSVAWPLWVPVAGFLVSLALVGVQATRLLTGG
ncbi:MAG: APC family permease [Halofilum sp. (in: g-proteobacteria)]|nr:APC family permease [Halofilum sp. (in: g-proteobacteria)]